MTRIMMQLYRKSFPVWDLENFRLMDFCWHECTKLFCDTYSCLLALDSSGLGLVLS